MMATTTFKPPTFEYDDWARIARCVENAGGEEQSAILLRIAEKIYDALGCPAISGAVSIAAKIIEDGYKR
jgi:hypothetical protein